MAPNLETCREKMGDTLFGYLQGRPRDMAPDAMDPNEEAIARYRLVPRVMTGAAGIDTVTDFLGYAAAAPLLVGAYAADRIIDPDNGIMPIARAAAALSLPLMVSEECLTPFAEISAVHPCAYLQLRAAGPVERAIYFMKKSRDEGAKGIVFTVLTQTHPRPGLFPGGVDIGAEIKRRGLSTIGARDGSAYLPPFPLWNWANLTEAIDAAHDLGLKVVVKGILAPQDAAAARNAGADAVMVSNIGVRQTYRWAQPVECLQGIARTIPGLPIVLDGGIRKGADVIVAAALGAGFACTVRPVVYSAVIGGEQGAHAFLKEMIDDIAVIASWMGAGHPREIGPDHVMHVL